MNSRSSRLLHAKLLTAVGTVAPCEEPDPAPVEATVAAVSVGAVLLLKKSATHRHSEQCGILPVVRFLRLSSARFIASASPKPPPPFAAAAVFRHGPERETGRQTKRNL